jgi:hypothetical protein
MKPKAIYRIQDALAKLQAHQKLVGGGTQYTPDVSLAVANMARLRGKARQPKPTGVRPLPFPARSAK